MAKFIDIHTHYFPKEGLEGILRDFGEEYWLNLLFPKEGRGLQAFPSQAEFIEAMDEADISKAVINGAYWESWQACEYFNKTALSFANAYPDRILPMAIISPKYLDKSLDFLKRARHLGFVGVGELCDSVQGFDVLSEGFCEIVKTCQAEGLPICFHLSDELGKGYKGKVITNNNALFELAKKYPKQKFIFSHLAGGRAFSGAEIPKNVYMDTAAFPLLYKQSQWANLDFERYKNIAFATDYSIALYPKTSLNADFLRLRDEAFSNVPAKFHDNFFYNNACELFNLDASK